MNAEVLILIGVFLNAFHLKSKFQNILYSYHFILMKTDLIQVPTLADIQQAFECQNQLKVRCFQKLIRILPE